MNLIATITINSIWVPDKSLEAEKVFGSPDDKCHPAIAYLFDRAGSHYVGGEIQGFQLPVHYDFTDLRRTERAHSHARTFGRPRRSPTARCCLLPPVSPPRLVSPRQLRDRFRELSFQRIVGFQTRNPMHRSHRELTMLAARDAKVRLTPHRAQPRLSRVTDMRLSLSLSLSRSLAR